MMVEGRYDPDRLLAAVVGDSMSGEEFACYMLVSSLVLSRGAAPLPRHEAVNYLQTVFRWRPPQLDAIIARLRSIGRLTITDGLMDARLPVAARSAPPVLTVVAPAPPPQEKPKNGFPLDLFPETLPKRAPPPPDGIPIPPRLPGEPATLPTSPDAIRNFYRPEFERWYGGYPIKRAPDAALRAYVKARKTATFDELIAGRDRYAASVKNEDPHLIKHPATWLNAGCWRDDLPAPPEEERAWV